MEDPRDFGDGELGPAFEQPPHAVIAELGRLLLEAPVPMTLERRDELWRHELELVDARRYPAFVNASRCDLNARWPDLSPLPVDPAVREALRAEGEP